MKRFLATGIVLLLLCTAVFAEIASVHFAIPESEDEFVVDYTILKGMKKMKFPAQEDMHVTKAYKLKSRGHEGVMTYSLFKDTGVSEENCKVEVYIWTLLCTMNISGISSESLPRLTMFGDNDVKGEFNGDCGTTNFLQGEFTNEFLKDYRYACVESFYKKGQGIVVRVAMSNDLAFFGVSGDGSFNAENTFNDFYDTFRFRD